MKKRYLIAIVAMLALLFTAGSAMADTSVSWTNPADGTSYTLPANVNPQGRAGTSVSGGLDLALVMDSSGSMTTSETVDGDTKTRAAWQKQFARDLVASLPTDTTSVSVIEYDSSASTVQQLLALTPASNITTINSKIDSVGAFGGTNIGSGIDKAANELTSVRADVNRSQMMAVFSDGFSSGSPGLNADSAILAGVEAIHSVGLPGHNDSTMKAIVDGLDNTYGTLDDHGTYTDGSDLQALKDIFSGTGGSLVGIDRVEIELPDGTVLNSADGDFSVGALGNFQVPNPYWDMELGINTFVATAYGNDSTIATANLNLYGTQDGTPVPEPASVMLLGMGLLGLVPFARKRMKK